MNSLMRYVFSIRSPVYSIIYHVLPFWVRLLCHLLRITLFTLLEGILQRNATARESDKRFIASKSRRGDCKMFCLFCVEVIWQGNGTIRLVYELCTT